jgi:hypothetical protein
MEFQELVSIRIHSWAMAVQGCGVLDLGTSIGRGDTVWMNGYTVLSLRTALQDTPLCIT